MRRYRSKEWNLEKVFRELLHSIKRPLESGNSVDADLHVRALHAYHEVFKVGDANEMLQLKQAVDNRSFDDALRIAIEAYERCHIKTKRVVSTDSPDEKFLEGELDNIPTIEVLYVDDREEAIARFQREIKEHEFPTSRYFIDTEIVPAQNIQDAKMQVLRNPRIKIAVIDWELQGGTTGKEVIESLQEMVPNLEFFILTGKDPLALVVENPSLPKSVRAFYKDDPTSIPSLFQSMVASIEERARTPFFSALLSYSKRPVSVFHAQITSGGKSLRKSAWLSEFYRFYGKNVFNGETTTTLEPLDSLLAPSGSIKDAQELAAKAFGARKTFFCTNGTSTAIKIVYQGLLKPDDVVLIDRCCHKAHHYGLVLTGAHPRLHAVRSVAP